MSSAKNRKNNEILKVCTFFVKCMVLIIITVCFFISILTSAHVDIAEHTYYTVDHVIINIVVIIVLITSSLVIKSRVGFPRIGKGKLQVVTIFYVMLMSFIVLNVSLLPKDDPMMVLEASKNLLNGDYSWWSTGYCAAYPQQNGIILFFSIFVSIFGENSFLAIQLFNVFMLVVSAWALSKISELLFENEKITEYCYIAALLFVPLNFYVTFVYGTLIGLSTAMVGILLVIKFLRNGNIKECVLGIVCLVCAVFFKKNYIIFLIASCLLLLFYILKRYRAKNLILIVIAVVLYISGNWMITSKMEAIVGHQISKGIPSLAWVEMGLQDGPLAPGWYNQYNSKVWGENNGDAELMEKQVKHDLSETVKYLVNEKKYTAKFFLKKVSSEWNDGTFSGIWINQNRKTTGEFNSAELSLLNDEGRIHQMIQSTCDVALSVSWLGVILFLVCEWKRIKMYQLISGIIFIGGFVFHLFWEGKSQYTIVYIYLMIPYIIRGYQSLILRICQVKEKG